ncbi:MAG: AzlD domain-containing protein [Acidimicrobiia bacterium]
MSWGAILILAAGSYAFKALGLLAFDAKPPSPELLSTIRLLPPAVLGALIMVQTFATDDSLVLDARAVGLAAGAVAAWRKAPFIVVLVVAAAATALTRALL